MKQNDCDDFPDTVIIGSSALYPLAKCAILMLILFLLKHHFGDCSLFLLMGRPVEYGVGVGHELRGWS